ncbi:MAG: hypothetical protein ABIV94_01755 [Acidimicrobiales bacterium]
MADVGDKVSVASKSGPRLGVVVSTSGSMLRVRWESGGESSLVPGPGMLTVVGKTRKRPATGAAKSTKGTPRRPVARVAVKAATAGRGAKKTVPTKAAAKKSTAAAPAKVASKATKKKAPAGYARPMGNR